MALLLVTAAYVATFPSLHLSDPFILQFPTLTPSGLFERIDHLLSLPILYIFWLIPRSLGFEIEPLAAAQAGNLVMTLATLFVIYAIARRLGLTIFQAWITSLLLVFSFSSWAYASGELHHSGLLFLCIAHLLLLHAMEKGRMRDFSAAGAISALAVACHIELGTFPVAVFLVLWRFRGIRLSLVFLASGLACGLFVYVIVASAVHGVRTPGEFVGWIISGLTSDSHEAVFGFNLRNPVRLIKSQLTAFYIGFQYVHDIIRYHDRMTFNTIMILLSALFVLVLFMWAVMRGIRFGIHPEFKHRQFLVITCSWFLIHKLTFGLLVNSWLPEFSLVTLVPLLLLCGLGMQQRTLLTVLLPASLILGNLGFWAIPRKIEARELTAAIRQVPLDDLDAVYVLNPQGVNPYLYRNDWCLTANGDVGVLENGEAVMESVTRAFSEGRRVYLFVRERLKTDTPEELLRLRQVALEEAVPSRLQNVRQTLLKLDENYVFRRVADFPFRYRGHVSYGLSRTCIFELRQKSEGE